MRSTAYAHPANPYDFDDETLPRSQRTTFDMAALASVAGLCDSRGNVPLDYCVLVRTDRVAPSTITRDEIRMLLYVDGEASLKHIAEETELSLPETIAIFLSLFREGLVEVAGERTLAQTFVKSLRA